MDIQTRKLNAIEYLIGLQDEKTFNIIEESIRKTMTQKKNELKRFTQGQLI